MKRYLVPCIVFAALAFTAPWGAASDGLPYSLSVKRSHFIGSSSGTLRITTDGIQYDTAAKDEARRWAYPDIKQLQIQSPTRVVVLTYEDQGRLKLGADRSFDFEVRDGSVSPDLVAFLLSHTDRPIVTAVVPPRPNSPLFRVPVKHERQGRGSEGTLLMYDDALIYATERATEARYWRFKDLFAVLPLDRYRLQVLAHEGGGGDLRPFTFQVKSELPDAFARALWDRVNPPAPARRPLDVASAPWVDTESSSRLPRYPFATDARRWPRLVANTTECTLSFNPVARRHWWQ